jgi:hypothetical protein
MSSRFYLWLKDQTGRDDPVGDFALDAVSKDGGFPHKEDSKTRIRYFIRYATSGDRSLRRDILAALDEAWVEFERFDAKQRRTMSPKMRFWILRRDGYKCRLCGRSAPAVALEVDHVVAVSKGGASDEPNLMTLCFDCNRGKGTSSLTE